MGDTVILATIYFFLITVGTVWVIIWGMRAAGPHPKYKAKIGEGEFIHVRYDRLREFPWCRIEQG